jgi:hypothetical protein
VRKFFLFFSIFLLTGIWLVACNAGPKAQEFKSGDGRFTVIAPVAMKETVGVLDTAAGKINLHQFLAQQGDTAYIVGYCDYPQAFIQKSDPEKIIDNACNGAVSHANGKLISETKIRIEGNPGRELVIEGKAENGAEAMAKIRVFLVKNRLYQVMVAVPKGGGNLGAMNHFLGSFRLIELAPNPLRAQNDHDLFSYPPGHFSFNLPSGWKIIPNNIVDKYVNKLLIKYKTLSKPKYDLVFNRVNALEPFEYPYFMIATWKQKVNKSVIEKWVTSAQQITKKAITEHDLKDFFYESLIRQPIYDKDRHIIIYSVESKIKGIEKQDNYQTMIVSLCFYKDGIVSLVFYCYTKDIIKNRPVIDKILQSFTFDKGYEYR